MLQEQAIEMIKRIPEDKIYYVVNILQSIEGLFTTDSPGKNDKAQTAYQELQRYRKSSQTERNYKAELAEALEEKYAGVD